MDVNNTQYQKIGILLLEQSESIRSETTLIVFMLGWSVLIVGVLGILGMSRDADVCLHMMKEDSRWPGRNRQGIS